ncbi:MAG: phytanoyl-CoA dioxygenase family protein [Acidobacteriota bacterium]|nr:phytanoyl-CoA dioxygenase family protein [Acidobacteriota bacterium]
MPGATIEIEDVLRQCGVTETTLPADEKEQLDRLGYILLPNVVDAEWLTKLRTAFEAALEPSQTDAEQTGTRHPADLIRKDAAFDGVHTHPKLLAAIHHILRRAFQLQNFAGRDPLPGFGQQGLHGDWVFQAPYEPNYAATALWLLDDFTETNGATRLIPGSHLWERPLPKAMQQPNANHPEQQTVTAKAGSVLIFNGHLYHSGTRNDSKLSRRVLQLTFVAREASRINSTPENLPDRLTPAARYLLGG